MVFMEAARGGCRVLSSSCLPWFSLDGSYRAIMVSECYLFSLCFFAMCVCQAVMCYREFLSAFFIRMGFLMLGMKALPAMFPRLRWL